MPTGARRTANRSSWQVKLAVDICANVAAPLVDCSFSWEYLEGVE
jgi:hypothetical protein